MKHQWTKGSVKVGKTQITYHRTGGNLPALVLAHGLTDNGLCWSRVAKRLEADIDIIMLDTYGHGLSSRVDTNSSDCQGDDVAALIKALKLDKPIIMGHSVGASLMAKVASRHSDLISKVILEDPVFMPKPSEQSLQARINGFQLQVEKFNSMTLEQIETLGKKLSPNWHQDEFEQWAIAKHQVDAKVLAHYEYLPWQQTIASIQVPTLLIHGDTANGGIISNAVVAEAKTINPTMQSAYVENSGHNIHRENLDGFIAALQPFLL